MENEYHNIYIDIDSILDFRIRVIEALGFNTEELLSKYWDNRVSDNILGLPKSFIYSIIENETSALFASCSVTNIEELIKVCFLDGYTRGVESGKDICITLYVDLKDIELTKNSLESLKKGITLISPSKLNIEFVNTFKIAEYDSIIMYDSLKLLEYLVITNADYSSKKLYTPFLLDRLVSGINPKSLKKDLIEVYKPFIDIDYPKIKYFSKKVA